MSIYINKDTRVLVQGITGKAGFFHTTRCLLTARKLLVVFHRVKAGRLWKGCRFMIQFLQRWKKSQLMQPFFLFLLHLPKMLLLRPLTAGVKVIVLDSRAYPPA
jgi:succinyl-CoA synthetase alpha subunit